MVGQKHAKTRSKCHFEAIWGPTGQMERRRTSFVYYAWASTTCIEAFVLLVAALAPFTSESFAAGTARPLADYQRWKSWKGACSAARNLIGQLLNNFFRAAHAF